MNRWLAPLLRRARNLAAPQPRHGWWLLAAVVCLAASQSLTLKMGASTVPEITVSETLLPEVLVADDPSFLSPRDTALYQSIFAAEEHGDTRTADQLVTELANPRLIGHVLAARYLAPHYVANDRELAAWLNQYSDHPQAARMMALAQHRGVNVESGATEKPLRGDGYTDHLGRSTMPEGWYRALSLWREKNYADAAPLFMAVAETESLSDWQRAAGHYWAYRTANMLGDTHESRAQLKQAAQYGTTFYGLLASQKIGALRITARAPEVADTLRADARTTRAALLAQLGRNEAAEDELRHLYSATNAADRPGIVTLASEMNLANLQVRLGSMPQLNADEAMFAKYPTPVYMLNAAEVMDPALLLAIARNESGFREIASSGAGAVGMMQMLPSTARAVERHVGVDSLALASNSAEATASITKRLSDPAVSVRFGAQYLKLLMREPAIGNSLIRLLAGYNAGPGTVAGWQAAARQVEDPLLYIESIPYPETRNYVMQVIAQYWIYQTLLGAKPATLASMSQGQWPTV